MASEDKQLDVHKVEVMLDLLNWSKDTAARAHTTSEEAIAALAERTLKAVWIWIAWLPLLSFALVGRTLKRSISWLPLLSFGFMGYSAITALHESKGERGTVFFVVGSFTLLGLLYLCMKEFEKTKGVPSKKGNLLKVAVWILSVLLTILFSHRVTVIVDSPILDIFVWTIAILTSALGGYLLFFHEQSWDSNPAKAGPKPGQMEKVALGSRQPA